MGIKRTETSVRVRRAVKGRGFLTPAYRDFTRMVIILVGGAYLRFVEGVKRVGFINESRIIGAMKKFHSGETRLIFVFRHAAEEDPPVLMYAFTKALRRRLRERGKLSHLRFLYGRDVPNWAGPAAAWIFPKLGAVPVQNRGGNREALDLLRTEAASGRFPLILAPEEQVVYHMYRTFDLAPGIASLVKWGLESGKPVTVVPLSMGYRYGSDPEKFIRRMLERWVILTGIELEDGGSGKLHPLLAGAAMHTVSMLEQFYGIAAPEDGETPDPEKIDLRIKGVCRAALTAAERAAGLESGGSGIDRLFRIRYAGTDAIYPENIDPAQQPVMRRALLDFRALKAEVSVRHSQIVDVLEYVSLSYIDPPFSAGRGCEFILNLLDVINRADGGDISSRYSPKGQHAVIYAGEPLLFENGAQPEPGRRRQIEDIKSRISAALQTASAGLENEWEEIWLE